MKEYNNYYNYNNRNSQNNTQQQYAGNTETWTAQQGYYYRQVADTQTATRNGTDANKILLGVAIGLGTLAIAMGVILVLISFSDRIRNDDTEISWGVSNYIFDGVGWYSNDGQMYYEPVFGFIGDYVDDVESEINSDLDRLRDSNGDYYDNVIFGYKAYLNGDILSIKFESGYKGNMKSRYYNINVVSGERASLDELRIQAGMSDSDFSDKLRNSQLEKLAEIYASNGWGDVYSKSLICSQCEHVFTSDEHIADVRYYLDENCKIHIVNYYPGGSAGIHVLKDVICE